MYSDLFWRLSQRWVVGGRYDYVESPFGPDDPTWRATGVVTWWQSEFVFLRLQCVPHPPWTPSVLQDRIDAPGRLGDRSP